MNIVIVGGGTAGWLSALLISKARPEHTVTLVESSAIGIVGAGEGSTGLLTSILKNEMCDFGCDLLEFLQETNATLKYGIYHKDWKTVGESYMGPIGGTPSTENVVDYIFAHYHSTDPANVHLSSIIGQKLDRKVSNFNKKTMSFDTVGTALHFDAHEVGKYFKKVTLKNPNVSVIDNEVVDINLDSENGNILSVLLKSGQLVSGDFFVDASGFKQVLVKKIGTKWVSYRRNLPVNSAMPFLLPYKEGEYPELYTTAWAQKSGWMWQIPNQHRKGCGYVFDDNFITAEQAQAEIETTLGRPIDPIRVLKFDTGRLENVWEKNCLAVGLAAAFAEPLEATSIHTTIAQLVTFAFEFLKPTLEDTLNLGSRNSYNRRTAKLYDTTKEFLIAHYMGGRVDSEFWKYISSGETKTEFVDNLLEMSKTQMPSNRDLDISFGTPDMGLWSFVLAGIGKITPETSAKIFSGNTVPIIGLSNMSSVIDGYQRTVDNMLRDNLGYIDFINFIKRTSKQS
jgi:tryptophan halogenase